MAWPGISGFNEVHSEPMSFVVDTLKISCADLPQAGNMTLLNPQGIYTQCNTQTILLAPRISADDDAAAAGGNTTTGGFDELCILSKWSTD